MDNTASQVVPQIEDGVKSGPSVEYLRECFEYNPETGDLIWKERPLSHFKDAKAYRRFCSMCLGKSTGNYALKESGRRAARFVTFSFFGRIITMTCHKVAWLLLFNEIPEGKRVDHKNGDPWDNRLENLRLSTHQENSFNVKKRKDKADGLPKGVKRQGKKFCARICKDQKHIWIGTYSSVEAAEQAYKDAAQQLFGEYATHLSRGE